MCGKELITGLDTGECRRSDTHLELCAREALIEHKVAHRQGWLDNVALVVSLAAAHCQHLRAEQHSTVIDARRQCQDALDSLPRCVQARVKGHRHTAAWPGQRQHSTAPCRGWACPWTRLTAGHRPRTCPSPSPPVKNDRQSGGACASGSRHLLASFAYLGRLPTPCGLDSVNRANRPATGRTSMSMRSPKGLSSAMFLPGSNPMMSSSCVARSIAEKAGRSKVVARFHDSSYKSIQGGAKLSGEVTIARPVARLLHRHACHISACLLTLSMTCSVPFRLISVPAYFEYTTVSPSCGRQRRSRRSKR